MRAITEYWNGLRLGNESALVGVYHYYYKELFRYGLKCAANEDLTRDTINELFLELWDKRHTLPEVSNVKQYLLTWYKRKLFKKLHLYIRVYTDVVRRTWEEKMYLYPIPTQELQLNPQLAPQNPGW